MEYAKGEQFLGDFAMRTLKNIDVIEKESKISKDAYEVTQLVNSLLGLIVFPKERNLPQNMQANWFKQMKKHVIYPKDGLKEKELSRNLRNAISHAHIYFEKDNMYDAEGKAQIKSVIFVSCDYVSGKTQCPTEKDCISCRLKHKSSINPDFQLTIPVDKLKACVKDMANEIVNATGVDKKF